MAGGRRVVLASGNAGKLRELSALLAGQGFELLAQTGLGVTAAEETGLSFCENAILKARHAARATGLPAIADDSGLAVDALDGRPGIYSARFAGPGASDADNVEKLLTGLGDVEDAARTARFICVIVAMRHEADPVPVICQGQWAGSIARAPAGAGGFGYDPVFVVPGLACTAAELSPEHKNRISHRGQALRQLAGQLAHWR